MNLQMYVVHLSHKEECLRIGDLLMYVVCLSQLEEHMRTGESSDACCMSVSAGGTHEDRSEPAAGGEG